MAIRVETLFAGGINRQGGGKYPQIIGLTFEEITDLGTKKFSLLETQPTKKQN